MASFKNLITIIGIATAAGGGSTMAMKNTDIMQTVQTTIASLQDSVSKDLMPIIEKVMQNQK